MIRFCFFFLGCTFYREIGGKQTFGGFTLVEEALRGKGTGAYHPGYLSGVQNLSFKICGPAGFSRPTR
jgi:hypothetical protein